MFEGQVEDVTPVEPDEFPYGPPIEYKTIKGLSKSKLCDYGKDLYTLIGEGMRDRDNGGRNQWVAEWRKIFDLLPPERSPRWEGGANIRTPSSRSTVDTLLARMIDVLFGDDPYLRATPINSRIDSEASDKIQEFLQAELEAPCFNIRAKMIRSLKDALIDGLSVGKTSWKTEVRKRKSRPKMSMEIAAAAPFKVTEAEIIQGDPSSGIQPSFVYKGNTYTFGQRYEIEREEVTANHFDLSFVKYEDQVMFPANAEDCDEATLCGHFFRKTLTDVEYGIKDGMYDRDAVKRMKEKGAQWVDIDSSGWIDAAERSTGISNTEAKNHKDYGWLNFFEGYARIIDADGDGLKEDVFFTLELSTMTLLRFRLNPYWNGKRPFKDLTPEPRRSDLYHGYSQIEKLYDLQKEDDTTTNMVLDAGAMSLSFIVEQEQGSRRELADHKFRPGPTFWNADTKGKILKLHTMPQNPSTAFSNRADVRNMMEKVSGASEAMQGAGQNTSGEALGQTQIAISSGSIRLMLLITYCLKFLTWLYNQQRDYYLQFMDETYTYTLIRGDRKLSKEITLDELAIPVVITAYSPALDPDRNIKRQFAEKAFVAVAQSPFAQADLARSHTNLHLYLKNLGLDNSDIEELIGTKEEAQRLQEKLAEEQKAQKEQAPPPDPAAEAEKAKAEGSIAVTKATTDAKMQTTQLDTQAALAKHAMEMQSLDAKSEYNEKQAKLKQQQLKAAPKK